MVKFKNIKKQSKQTKSTKKQSKKEAKKEIKIEKEVAAIKQAKKRQLPNIYRIISERRFWLHVVNVLALLGILLIGIGLGKYVEQAEAINKQRESVENHIQYLQDLSNKYPGDRDIYLEMAIEEYRLGNMKQANIYVEKALILDPNYLPALKLKGFIITHK